MDARDGNRWLELRIKDLAAKSPTGTLADRKARLARCLGLDPLPPRTELNAKVTGTVERDGYRIDKIRYESRPEILVTAHLYLPEGTGKWPVILRPHGHLEFKKTAPAVQGGGISLALAGYACLIVDSPGMSWDDESVNERPGLGPHEDWFLGMGSPVQGVYAWDLMRGLDYLATRNDIDIEKVGITGASGGGISAIYTFALDDRIRAAVPVGATASLEMSPQLGCLCSHVPGISATGDYSDVMGLRADNGAVMILAPDGDAEFPIEAHLRTDEKTRRIFRSHKRESHYRFERFHGGRDYNRRMREAALAFFDEHLRGMPSSPYTAEARPITDGVLNPYPAETVDPRDPMLIVTGQDDRATLTFRDLLTQALAEPHPDPYRVDQRLVTWRKYGTIENLKPGAIVAIHDESVTNPKEPSSMLLPDTQIDERLCLLLGLSVAEYLAQILHFSLPGGPESWESSGTGVAGDALTSMIASVRTLVSTPEAPPKLLVAEGPVASMVARFFNRYRPTLETQSSHLWTSWREALDQGIRENAQPGARYLEWV